MATTRDDNVTYHHQLQSTPCELPVGKAVCVGRNYADHAKELNNPIPDSPLLFIKPSTAIVPFEPAINLPTDKGVCHFELEVALLIGQRLSQASVDDVMPAILGYGLALDLTLRELQSQLKEKGQPWEKAKAFDGALPLSPFVPASEVPDWRALGLQLYRNDQLQQDGACRDMLFGISDLLAEISNSFTLLPGDVVLTGTPAGVGPLQPGDSLDARLSSAGESLLQIHSQIPD